MSHNIFNDRFFSHREPAWHGLGKVMNDPVGAQEAFGMITPYNVVLRPLYVPDAAGANFQPVDQNAIIREPVPDDPQERLFGVVSNSYVLITPQEICEVYDSFVSSHVETMGMLGYGEKMFLTTQLPSFDVMGDECKTYMLLYSPYTGVDAIQVRVTPVRVVCQNTLTAAKRASSEVYRITHNVRAKEHLAHWMQGLMARSEERVTTLAQAFDMFAQFAVGKKATNTILNKIYPDPRPPRIEGAPGDIAEVRESDYEYALGYAQRSRTAVQELFEGVATGSDMPGFQGTGWGLYNSVVEYEDYRPTSREGSDLVNALFGDRAARKEKAYAVVAQSALK